jgi:hypothetical protein
MFQRIQNLFSGLGYALEYGGTIRNVTTAMRNYPGLDDNIALRLWLRPLLTDAATLALLTKTAIDDIVVQAAMRILDNNNSWAVVHGMALLVQDGFNLDGSLVPANNGEDVFEMSRRVANETMPECPSAVISAIGVILFLLQRIPNQNK